jgi:hypothetical protein
MAARENQGLQIALILFVILTVILAGFTYYVYKNGQEANEELKNRSAELEEVKKARDVVYKENMELKEMLGFKDKEELGEIRKIFAQDMLAFEPGYQSDNIHYRALPPHLLSVINAKSEEVVSATDRVKQLEAELARVKTEAANEVALVQKKFTAMKTDYDTVRTKYVADVDRITGLRKDLTVKLDRAAKEIATVKDTSKKQLDVVYAEAAQLKKKNEALVSKANEKKTQTFEVPDAKIVDISPREQLVWINVGHADNIRRQVKFSVHEQGTSNVMSSQSKGSIEVTKVVGEHMSEARIVDEDTRNPILRGDVVYSPTWTPGRQLRFALAGFMDIDGDGKSDRKEVRNLILSHNGLIDADVDELGNRQGQLSIDTKYLVLGDRPTEKTATEALAQYSAIQDQAHQLGVEKIPLAKLLDMMGYAGSVKSVSLGRHARSEDFKAKPDGGVVRPSGGSTSEIFKPRSPRSAYP